MNERIQELFKRAGGRTSARNLASNPVQVVETHELWDDRIQKFAELIVKECAYLVNDQQRTTGYTTHVQMLCREFGIEFKEEDYWKRNDS